MPVFKIQHITTYNYDRLIRESVNETRIFPVESEDQQIIEQNLVITGNPEIAFFFDNWGNKTGTFNLNSQSEEIFRTVLLSKVHLKG
jgi:hypothetical protein